MDAWKGEWLTPPEIVGALGVFDLDPCAPVKRPWPTAAKHYTVQDDGLALPWVGRVWLNPPYGRHTGAWFKRMAAHRDGLALIFARTETAAWHDYIWPIATGFLFLRGRVCFYHNDGTRGGTSNAPSVLVAYGSANLVALSQSNLAGWIVDNRRQTKKPRKTVREN